VTRRTAQRLGIVVLVLAALAFFAYSLRDAWNRTHGELPSVARLSVSAILICAGLIAASVAWATLLGGTRRIEHAAGLLVAQLGKYVPGVVWQAAGQVGLARSAGVRVSRGVVAFTVMALTQTVAGCTYAILLAFAWSSASVLLRIALGIGGVAAFVLLDRRWMAKLLHRIPRTRDAPSDVVPSQPASVGAWAASVVTLGANSAAFVVMLGSFGRVHDPGLVVAAYAAAWTVGFVAVPVPSGVGIREAVLVAILHGSFPSSVLVAASVYHRLVSIGTEGIMAAIASHRVRPARLRASATPTRDEQESVPREVPSPEAE
jgi:uncharacterized membrane protein YbhN (UPF0104 family)